MKRTLNRISCLLLSVLMATSFVFYIKFTAGAVSILNPVTVKMTSLGSSVKTISVTINGSYMITENSTNLPALIVYTVAVSGVGLTITGGGISYTFGSSFNLSKQDNSLTGIKIHNPILNKDFNYLGNMNFSNISGNIVVTNFIDVQTYLYGVVSQEMGDSFHIEALKAQAIAARTCVYNKNFSVTDDITTQTYIGYNASFVKSIKAVDDTRDMVLTYNGDLIEAYYSASNGGYTERTDYIWSKYLPYYQVLRDDYDYNSTINIYHKPLNSLR